MAKIHPALAAVQKSTAAKVKVAVSDIDGILRGKYLHRDKFLGAAEPFPKGGFGFCDVVFGWDSHDNCYDNTTVTGWQHGFPDALARLDLDTARHVPWDNNVPFFLGEFVNADGSPYPVCPRQTLKRVLKRAEKLGVLPMAGMEFEWFNFLETPQSWADKREIHSSPRWCRRASTFETIGTSASRGLAAASATRSRSRAGFMRGVWNAPETGSGMTFFAPSSLACWVAFSMPLGVPAITTCPGALKLATHTLSSARRQATSTRSSSRPSTADIAPGEA